MRLQQIGWFVVLSGGAVQAWCQVPAAARGTASSAVVAPSDRAAIAPLSLTVAPAVSSVRNALALLRVERWKSPRDMRSATDTNVSSIEHDLDATLPGLLQSADSAPGSVAGLLPVARNLAALYDVLLRVTVVAEPSAPGEQTAALEGALTSLDSARRSLTDRLQSQAEAQEAKLTSLQKLLAAQPAASLPCTPAAPAPKPALTPKRKKKHPAPPAPPAAQNSSFARS